MTRHHRNLVTLLLVLLSLGLLVKPLRDLLLLQTEASAIIPFLFVAVGALAPYGAALLARIRRHAWRVVALEREARVWLLLGVMILVETLADPALTRFLGYDLTPLMRGFEGDLVARIQDAARSPAADWFFALVYSYGFAFLYGFLPGLLLLLGRREAGRAVLRAILLVWMVGIPSYLFVPVDEPWSVGIGVANVLHEVMPPSANQSLVAAAINNEFPSLHAAHSIAIGATLWRLERRLFLWLLVPILGVPLATVYLGVHWVADLAAGLVLGLAAAWLGPRMPWFRRGEASENRYKDDPLASPIVGR